MEVIQNLVGTLNGFLWSYVLIIMLIGLGLWFTVRSGFVQLRCIKEMVRLITKTAAARWKKTVFLLSRRFASVRPPA